MQSLHVIRERDMLLDHRFLQGALTLRNPYVDALNLLQVSLLKKKRQLGEDDPQLKLLDAALGTTPERHRSGHAQHGLIEAVPRGLVRRGTAS